MEHLSNLLLYLILATLSGLINTIIAWIQLQKKCRHLIFYKPVKTFLFWIWLILQTLIPAIFFWYMVIQKCPEKPSLSLPLIIEVVIYGIFFQGLSNATESAGITPVNVIIPLNFFNNFFYDYLNASHRVKTGIFWNNLEKALNNLNLSNRQNGISFLKRQYFTEPYLNSQEYEYFQQKLEEIAQELDPETQCKKLVTTCFKGIIPREDLPSILNQFQLNFENLVQETLDNLR